MKSSDVDICVWVPAWCVHAYMHKRLSVCVLSIQIVLLLTDYKSILMTRILCADAYLVHCLFSLLYFLLLAIALSFVCLIARSDCCRWRWCCWKLITPEFYPFSPQEFSEFSSNSNWVSTLFKYISPFSLCLSLAHIFLFTSLSFLKKIYFSTYTCWQRKENKSGRSTH